MKIALSAIDFVDSTRTSRRLTYLNGVPVTVQAPHWCWEALDAIADIEHTTITELLEPVIGGLPARNRERAISLFVINWYRTRASATIEFNGRHAMDAHVRM